MSIKRPVRIAFAARKGGEGKTFGAANIAGELVCRGYKVLIIVCDQQDDLAKRYLIDQEDGKKVYDPERVVSLCEVLLGEAPAEDAIYQTREYPVYHWEEKSLNEIPDKPIPGSGKRKRTLDSSRTVHLDIVPAGMDIFDIDVFFEKDSNGEYIPRYHLMDEVFAEVFRNYDFIIFDTPPSAQNISMIAYASSDYIFTPFEMVGADSAGSVEAVSETIDGLNSIPEVGREIKLRIYMTKYRATRALDLMNEDIVRSSFKDNVFTTPIRDSAEASYSKADGTPLACYRKTAIAEDVSYIVDEFLSELPEEVK